MKKKDLIKQIDDLNNQIDSLTKKIDYYREYSAVEDELIHRYSEREKTILDVLGKIYSFSDDILSNAEKKSKRKIAHANKVAKQTIDKAKKEADMIEAESIEKLNSYNASIQKYKLQLKQIAESAQKKIDNVESIVDLTEIADIKNEEKENIEKQEPEEFKLKLANPDDNPVALMHNIYKLQNRELPENINFPEIMDTKIVDNKKIKQISDFQKDSFKETERIPDTIGEPENAELHWVSELIHNDEDSSFDSLNFDIDKLPE